MQLRDSCDPLEYMRKGGGPGGWGNNSVLRTAAVRCPNKGIALRTCEVMTRRVQGSSSVSFSCRGEADDAVCDEGHRGHIEEKVQA